MSDVHDLLLVLDLRPGLPAEQIEELRWHLGLGPQPARPTIVTDFYEVVLDDDAQPVRDESGAIQVESDPRPLLAQTGAARHAGGALVSQLTSRDDGGWALTSRQELHPDEFDRVNELLAWLAANARPGTEYLGYVRPFEQAAVTTALTLTNGTLNHRL
jgi:hypothetical protein